MNRSWSLWEVTPPTRGGTPARLRSFTYMDEFFFETATGLRAQSSEILRRWETRVLAEIPAASTIDAEVLRDHRQRE